MAGVRGYSCRNCWRVLKHDQFPACQRNAWRPKCSDCEKARGAKNCAQTDAAKKGATDAAKKGATGATNDWLSWTSLQPSPPSVGLTKPEVGAPRGAKKGAARGAQRATTCKRVEYTAEMADVLEYGTHRAFGAEHFDRQVEEENEHYSSLEPEYNDYTSDW